MYVCIYFQAYVCIMSKFSSYALKRNPTRGQFWNPSPNFRFLYITTKEKNTHQWGFVPLLIPFPLFLASSSTSFLPLLLQAGRRRREEGGREGEAKERREGRRDVGRKIMRKGKRKEEIGGEKERLREGGKEGEKEGDNEEGREG